MRLKCQAIIGKFSLVAWLLAPVSLSNSPLLLYLTLLKLVSKHPIIQPSDNWIAAPSTPVGAVNKTNLEPVPIKCPDVHNVGRIKRQLILIWILEGFYVALAACVWYV